MIISETHESPYFLIDKDLGLILLKGKSVLILSKDFYIPIFEAVKTYVTDFPKDTKMIVDMEYFNTSSSKLILEIFRQLRKLNEKGFKVEINWYYDEYDDDMFDCGTDYSEIVKDIPFFLVRKDCF